MSSDRIVGIDLGTTNSLVAFMQGESPVVIPGDDGLNLLPSVVALDSNNHPVVGNAARSIAANCGVLSNTSATPPTALPSTSTGAA